MSNMIEKFLKNINLQQCLIGISLFSYLFFAYNISLREHVYMNNIILFLTLLLPIGILFWIYRKRIKELLPVTTKLIIASLFVLVLILFRNKDLLSGHIGLPYYYTVTVFLFIVLCNSTSWIKVAIHVLLFFTLEHTICTWLFYLLPNFYQSNIMPLFPEMFQSDLMYQFRNGQMAGLTYHYSTNGMYLAIGTILTFSMFLTTNEKKKKIFYAVLFLFTIGALLLTGKRAHLLFSVLVIALLYLIQNRETIKKAIPKLIIGIVILTIILGVLSLFIPALTTTFERFVNAFKSNDITNGRLPLYNLALDKFADSPIFGNGWGSYKYAYEEEVGINPNYDQLDAHNIYLQLLSEVGTVGTIIVLVVIFGSAILNYKLIQKYKLSLIEKTALITSLGIQVFVILYGITGNPIYDLQIFFQYMITLAITYAIFIEKNTFIKEKNKELYEKNNKSKGKIGVLTFQNTTNYGAELQKYALQKYIREQNYDCEVIDYKCEAVENRELAMNILKQRNIKSLIKCIMRSDSQYFRSVKFKNFANQYVKISDKSYTRENIASTNNKYDLFLVGSDQVWNMQLTNGDYTYLLDFVQDNEKKISYAASFGYKEIPEKYIEENKKLLNQFKVLSVREKQGKEILDEITEKESNITVDPTFLLTKEEWESLISDQGEKKKDYIFVYLPYYSKETFDFIRALAQKENCQIIYIHGSLRNEIGMKNLRTASPIDFLSLVKNAKYIVTGSFHAICFSLIFEKEFFYTVSTIKQFNSRLEDLISLVGLENRKVKDNLYISQNKIDYKKVKNLIENQIVFSKRILNKTIGDKNESN